jgi:2'-5' RNA ligase
MTALMTWLVPAASRVQEHLLATIDSLAADQDAPRFQPHVTLAPSFDSAIDAAGQTLGSLVADTPPVDVTFTAVGHEQTYFRALYLQAEPSAQLMALHEAAQRAWALAHWPFMPHLSLLYSDIPDAAKHTIIDGMRIHLPLTVRFDAIELWAGDDPEVRGWYRVARAPFAGLSQGEAH